MRWARSRSASRCRSTAASPVPTRARRIHSIGGEELHEWVVPLRAFREGHGKEGGEVNASTPISRGDPRQRGRGHHGPKHVRGGPGPWGDDPEGLVGQPALPHLGLRSHPPCARAAGAGAERPLLRHDESSPALEQARQPPATRTSLVGGAAAARQYLASGLLDEPRLDRPRDPRRRRPAVRQPGRPQAQARAGRGDRGAWRHAHVRYARV